jgi:hypothetical protein
MARIDKKFKMKPMMPRTSEAIASPLLRTVATVGGGTDAGWVMVAPHWLQKLLFSGFCAPHLGQYT